MNNYKLDDVDFIKPTDSGADMSLNMASTVMDSKEVEQMKQYLESINKSMPND